MPRGKRYDGIRKLNLKKVYISIGVLILIIFFTIYAFNPNLFKKENKTVKNIPNEYIVTNKNGKFGVVNSRNETIINNEYNELIVIPDKTKDLFVINETADLDNKIYVSKVLNKEGKKLFEEYDSVETLQSIDLLGNIIYSDSAFIVRKDNKYEIINFSGTNLLNTNYDKILPIKNTTKSMIIVKENKKGIVDNVGNIIAEPDFEEVELLTKNIDNGYIVKKDGKYGVISFSGRTILENRYEEIKNVYGNNFYVVKENGKYKLVNTEGTEKLESKFDDVQFIDSESIVIVKNNKYKLVDYDNNEKLKDYEYLEFAFDTNFIAKKDGKYGVINSSDSKVVEFEYKNIIYNSDLGIFIADKETGLSDFIDTKFSFKITGILSDSNKEKGYVRIRVGSEYKYYNLKLEEKNVEDLLPTNNLFLSKKEGKYGFVNKNGQVIINYNYDDATEQNVYGYAGIKKDGLWGIIDFEGNVVLEPKLKLNNNTVISFFDKLHLSVDINSNYYTDIEE